MLHYRTFRHATSTEWIVLLHGFGGTSSIWFRQIHSFSKDYNLLLMDLRGHGKSFSKAPDSHQYTFDEIAQDVLDVLDSLQLQQCRFVGVSMGTIVIRKIAELNILRVKSMVMAGAVVRLNLLSRFLLQIARCIKNITPYMWIYCFYACILMPGQRHRESRNMFICNALKLKRTEFMRWFSLTAKINPLLRSFRSEELPVPTLYLMGIGDYMFRPSVETLVKSHTQYSSLMVVPASGHVCNIDNTYFFNETVWNFLKNN